MVVKVTRGASDRSRREQKKIDIYLKIYCLMEVGFSFVQVQFFPAPYYTRTRLGHLDTAARRWRLRRQASIPRGQLGTL